MPAQSSLWRTALFFVASLGFPFVAHSQSRVEIDEARVSPCGSLTTVSIHLYPDGQVTGVQIGLKWDPGVGVEVVDAVPSPRISQDKLFAFFRSIADRDIGLNEGEATIGLVLEPGEHFEPGQTVEVVQLLLRAPDAAPGSVLELCTATDIGESEIDTAVSVSRDEMTISELVEPYCTQIGVDEAPEPLQILCPEELTVPAQSGGTPVSWATSTVGGCGDVVIECSHASGSLFAVGETTVTCEAKDENGTTDTCSFVVTVAGFGG